MMIYVINKTTLKRYSDWQNDFEHRLQLCTCYLYSNHCFAFRLGSFLWVLEFPKFSKKASMDLNKNLLKLFLQDT